MRIISLLAILAVVGVALAKPVPDRLKAKPEPQPAELLPSPIVNLTGYCQFGRILQTGRIVTISGGGWCATGEMQPDNSLILHWTCGGTEALGIYRPGTDGKMVGHYTYPGEGEILPNSERAGFWRPETLTPKEEPKAEGPEL